MGAGQSKPKKGILKNGKGSPQEKHVSADSTTPLATKVVPTDVESSTIFDKQFTFGEKAATRSRTNTSVGNTSIGPRDESDDIDAITPAPLKVHDIEGHSNVSRPPPPPRLHRMSELIDPADIPKGGHVRTRSGNMLGAAEFMAHPDRPRSIRERQEYIREKVEKVRAASRLATEQVMAAEEAKTAAKAAKKGKKAKKGGKEAEKKAAKAEKKAGKDEKKAAEDWEKTCAAAEKRAGKATEKAAVKAGMKKRSFCSCFCC